MIKNPGSVKRYSSQRGVSLVELILVVVAVALLALIITTLPNSVKVINKSRNSSVARNIANKQIDTLRKQTYSSLANGTNTFSSPDLNSLSAASAAYTIEDCSPTVCSNSEQAKMVTVEVLWSENGDQKEVELQTLISNGGLGQ